ncbi:MAG: PilN domain-containing protein [Gammaproteobacteria bacterium]
MAFEAANLNLFGLDLGALANGLRQGWAGVLRWPLLAWLTPADPIEVHRPDGSRQRCVGVSERPAPAGADAEFHALLLPQDLVLSRQLTLPHLTDAEIEAALRLELQADSPFPEARLDWGWRIDAVDEPGLKITLAFAATDHVNAHVNAYVAAHRSGLPDKFELWADAGGPVVLRGRGEAPRLAQARSRCRRMLLWPLLIVALLGALVLAPYGQLRQRTIDAQRQLEQIQNASTSYLDARAALVQADSRIAAVVAWRDGKADMLYVLHKLTTLLPDSAYLSRLDIEDRKVRITGNAADAAGLMETLRADAGVAELRALNPIVRGRDGRDAFYLEFMLGPEAAVPPTATPEAAPAVNPVSGVAP